MTWKMTWDRRQAAAVVFLAAWSLLSAEFLGVTTWGFDVIGQMRDTWNNSAEFLVCPLAVSAIFLFLAGLSPLMGMTLPVTGAIGAVVTLILASVKYFTVAVPAGSGGVSPVWLLILEVLAWLVVIGVFTFLPWALSAGLIRPHIEHALARPAKGRFGRWIRGDNAFFGVLVMGALVFVVLNLSLFAYDLVLLLYGAVGFLPVLLITGQSLFPVCLLCFGWAAVQEDKNGWWALLIAFVLCVVPVIIETGNQWLDAGFIYALLAAGALIGGVVGEIIRRRTRAKVTD